MIVGLLLAAVFIGEPGWYQLVTTTTVAAPLTSTSSLPPSSTTSSSRTTTTSTTTSSTIITGALGWYVAVTGSDTSGDGRRANPFKTVNKAIAIGQNGDSVILLDNADSQPYAPFVASKPFMVIRAEHEGQAAILTTGSRAVEITASNVRIEGLALRSADRSSGCDDEVLRVSDGVVNPQIIRNIVGWNNRHCNSHPIKLVHASGAWIVENACLNHSRHCVSITGGAGHRVLRNHINGRGYPDIISPAPGGVSNEDIALYPVSTSLVANNLIEGATGWGINLNATNESLRNRILGNIVAGTALGMKLTTRRWGVALGTLVQDQIFSRVSGSYDIRDQSAVKSIYDRVTAFAGSHGFEADDPSTSNSSGDPLSCVESTQDPSLTIRNSILGKLVIEACTGVTRKCEVSNSIATSKSIMSGCNVSGLLSTLPSDLGDSGAGKCLVRTSSPLGADVRCRIGDDGVKTSDPLWGPDGQFRFCPPVRAGWNSDAANRCDTYAERKLNHKRDGSGCPLTSLACS